MRVSWLLKYVLVLVLVLIITSTESLTGNVCTRTENYTATWRESFEEPVEVLTTSWCFSFPPRCSRYRTVYRMNYKIKSEERQRNISECCTGYTNQILWDENSQTNIQSCVAHSDCSPGYIGKNCTIECPAGTWGILCKNTCNCNPQEICTPTDGSCYCPAGWKGLECDNKCEEEKWGINCSHLCTCTNGSRCHHETGACIELINESDEDLIENISELSPVVNTSMSSIDSDEIISTINDLSDDDEINANFLESTDSTEVLLANNTEDDGEYTLSMLENIIMDELNNKSENKSVQNTTTGLLGNVAEKVQIPLPMNVIIFIVIGSIIFLGLIIAIFVVRQIRTKLCETLRLSIYDLEKPDTRLTALPKEKGNEEKINSISLTSELLTPSRDYEEPKCISYIRPSFTSPISNDVIIRESTYYNQYPHIHLFNSPRELLEAQYDKPPSTKAFSQLRLEFLEGEHLYDEIPFQSTLDDKSDTSGIK